MTSSKVDGNPQKGIEQDMENKLTITDYITCIVILIIGVGLVYFLIVGVIDPLVWQYRRNQLNADAALICASTIDHEVIEQDIQTPIWGYLMEDLRDDRDFDSPWEIDRSNYFGSWFLVESGFTEPAFREVKAVACIQNADKIVSTCQYTGGGTIIVLQRVKNFRFVDIESGVVVKEMLFEGSMPSGCPGSMSGGGTSSTYGSSTILAKDIQEWINENVSD